jgi:hypothetical protein
MDSEKRFGVALLDAIMALSGDGLRGGAIHWEVCESSERDRINERFAALSAIVLSVGQNAGN